MAALYVMIDGHGGDGAATFVQEHLPALLRAHMHALPCSSAPADLEEACKSAFIDTERAYAQARSADFTVADEGACVLAMIVLPDAIVFASAGDCRALIVHDTDPSTMAAAEHRCDDAAEQERVRKAGLFVFRGRVNGVLAVSRSIGDFELKTLADAAGGLLSVAGEEPRTSACPAEYSHAVTCVPSTVTVRRTDAQRTVLLMTDGVHDCVPTSSLTDLCRSEPVQAIPARAIELALIEFGHDNASALAFPLKNV
jgi:serine/threonine protein phosphatase PrpC